MSDSKQSDHWDLLASTLGAEPTKRVPSEPAPPAEEKMPKVEQDTDIRDSAAQAPSEPAATRPARAISNWDSLAMELGLEVKPEPPPPPAPAHLPVPKQVEKKTFIPDKRSREPRKPAIEEFAKQIEPLDISEKPSAEESEEPSEKKSRHRRRRRRKGREKDGPIAEKEKSSSNSGRGTPAEDDLMISEASIETADKSGVEFEEDSEEGESRQQRQKRRHSHRGSRKRKKTGDETAREKSTDLKKSDSIERHEQVDAAEPHLPSGDEEEVVEIDLEEGDQRGAKSGFRAIPTWDEAVGFIVTKNMESRPKRQGRGPSRSRSADDSQKRRRK